MTLYAPAESIVTNARTVPGVALVVGRALHAPWNEGSRVINRNFARAADSQRSVRVVSITNARFRGQSASAARGDPGPAISEVYTTTGYGLLGMYAGMPPLLRRLSRELRNQPVRVTHLFGVPLSIAPWLRQRRTRVITHVMGRSTQSRDHALVWASTRLFDRWIDGYAITSEVLRSYLEGFGINPRKIAVLPPAIDTELFRPDDRASARRQLGLSPTERLVIYLGRLSPRRFPADLVTSALTRAAHTIDTPLRFVALAPAFTFNGSENTVAGVLADNRAAAQQLREVADVSTELRQGNLADVDKAAWLRAADVVLLPFTQPEAVEPPLSLLEAMAAGAVVLVAPAANRSGLIQSGHNGLIYTERDQLAAALVDGLQRGGGSAMGMEARRTVLEGHSFAALAARTRALWARVEGTLDAQAIGVIDRE